MMPRFDPTVNLGHILTLLGVVVTIAGGGFVADFRLSAVEKEVAKLSSLVVEEARLGERLGEVTRRIDRIEAKIDH